MDVYIAQVQAWAPGLDSLAAWQQWAASARAIVSDDKPEARQVPAMTRRRLTRWGRQALEVAMAADGDVDAHTPVIFSSRHGDTERTYKLLEALADAEPLSPNAFSLSVHNSALGIYTILANRHAPSLALAGGRETFAQAWTEAYSWLATGTEQVLLVHTDEPLSDFYRADADEQELPAALALLLSAAPRDGAVKVSLSCTDAPEAYLPRSLMWEFLAWWHGPKNQLQVPVGQHLWSWERHAGTA
ncbi:MAG TPA: beta-ketoacyl synthase chain length factor [Cellvibrionaceae bacterium]